MNGDSMTFSFVTSVLVGELTPLQALYHVSAGFL